MSLVNPKKLEQAERLKYLNLLWSSVASLKTKEEVKNFFKDLLSETEAVMLGRRILIAKLLLEGKTYEEIGRELNTGRGTIAKVHQWLLTGFKGYERTLQQLEKLYLKKKSPDYYPTGFAAIRKKYPLHFLLFNILAELTSKEK